MEDFKNSNDFNDVIFNIYIKDRKEVIIKGKWD